MAARLSVLRRVSKKGIYGDIEWAEWLKIIGIGGAQFLDKPIWHLNILKGDSMYSVWHGHQQCATFQDQTAMVPKLQGFCPNYQPPSHGVNIYLGFLCKTWYCSHLSSWPGTSFKNSWIIQARQCGKPNNKPPNWGVLNHSLGMAPFPLARYSGAQGRREQGRSIHHHGEDWVLHWVVPMCLYQFKSIKWGNLT